MTTKSKPRSFLVPLVLSAGFAIAANITNADENVDVSSASVTVKNEHKDDIFDPDLCPAERALMDLDAKLDIGYSMDGKSGNSKLEGLSLNPEAELFSRLNVKHADAIYACLGIKSKNYLGAMSYGNSKLLDLSARNLETYLHLGVYLREGLFGGIGMQSETRNADVNINGFKVNQNETYSGPIVVLGYKKYPWLVELKGGNKSGRIAAKSDNFNENSKINGGRDSGIRAEYAGEKIDAEAEIKKEDFNVDGKNNNINTSYKAGVYFKNLFKSQNIRLGASIDYATIEKAGYKSSSYNLNANLSCHFRKIFPR